MRRRIWDLDLFRFVYIFVCLVRLVKGKFIVKVRMGGELGGPGAKPPGLGHSIQGGVRGGLPPGLGHGIQRGVRGACPLV